MNAASIIAVGKTLSSSATNSHKNFLPIERGAEGLELAVKNSFESRGHSAAVTLTRFHDRSSPVQASKKNPRSPAGVLSAIKLPSQIAMAGRRAAIRSSSTLAASSRMTRFAFEYPRVVFSLPGSARMREPLAS